MTNAPPSNAFPHPDERIPSIRDLHREHQLRVAVETAPILVVEAWLQSGVVPDEQTVSAALRR